MSAKREILRTGLIAAVVSALVANRPVEAAWHILAAYNAPPQSWTSSFEADPTNTDSLSQADDHMRSIKAEVRDREEAEHDFGVLGNVTGDTGRHLEGSARVFVSTTAPTVDGTTTANCIAEADRSGNRHCDEGRIWIDSDGLDNNAGTTADNYQANAAVDSDADGDADSWQPLTATATGSVTGTVPTNGIMLWIATSSCPSGWTEATEFRNVTVRGADIGATDGNIPNTAGVGCNGTSIGAGCSATDGTANYNDTLGLTEMPAHTHTGPSHTHDVVLGSHGHNIIRELADSDSGFVSVLNDHLVGDGNESGSLETLSGSNAVQTTDLGTKTSTAAGTGATGSTGTGNPHLHPFVTALFCKKT